MICKCGNTPIYVKTPLALTLQGLSTRRIVENLCNARTLAEVRVEASMAQSRVQLTATTAVNLH